MLLLLGSLSSKHFSSYGVHPDVIAGGVTWYALDDVVVLGVLMRPISMFLLLEGLSIFLAALDFRWLGFAMTILLLRGVLVLHFSLLQPGDVDVSPAHRSLVAFFWVFSWRWWILCGSVLDL